MLRVVSTALALALLCLPSHKASAAGDESRETVLAQAPATSGSTVPLDNITPPLQSGPTLRLPDASPIVFSSEIASQLASFNLPRPPQRAFAVAPGLEALTAVASVDDTQAVGEMVCEAAGKPSSALTTEESSDRMSLKISCPRARLVAHPLSNATGLPTQATLTVQPSTAQSYMSASMPPPAAHFWRIAYLKSNVSRVFNVATGLRIQPTAQMRLTSQSPISISRLRRSTLSRDEAEMGACINGFKRYKSDPDTGVFVVTFFRRAYHCQTAKSLTDLITRRSNAVFRNDFGRFLTPVGPAWLETPQLVFQVGPHPHGTWDPDSHNHQWAIDFPQTNIFPFESKLSPVYDPVWHNCNLECRPNTYLNGEPAPGQACRNKLGEQCNTTIPWIPPAQAARDDQIVRFATDRIGTFPVAFQVVSSVAGTLAAPTPFAGRAPSYQPPNPCDNWKSPPNLVLSEVLFATSHAPGWAGLEAPEHNYVSTRMPLALENAKYMAELRLNAQQLIDTDLVQDVKSKSTQQHHDFDYYARAVPLVPGPPSAPGVVRCSGVPTNWIRISLHDTYWEELAHAKELAAAEQQREAEDALFASVVGEDPLKSSPIIVEFAGFTHPAGNFTSFYESLPGFVTRPEGVPAAWPSKYGRKFNNDWPGGCSFSPWDVLRWPTQTNDDEGFWEQAWDDVVNVFDDFDKVYDLMKGFVVDALAYAVTGGQCAIDPLHENTASQSSTCNDLKTGLSVVENSAMALAGLPPQLPLASSIVNLGKGQIDAAIVSAINDAAATYSSSLAQGISGEQSGLVFSAVKAGGQYAGQTLADYTKDLADKTIDKVSTAFTCAETDDSVTLRNNEPQYSKLLAQAGANTLNDPQLSSYLLSHPDMRALVDKYGYFVTLDSRQCLSVATSPFTWGTSDALLTIHPAILWLQVRKNLQATAPRPDNVFVQIGESTRLTDDELNGVGIFEPAAAAVSMDAIEHAPGGFLLIPLVLNANINAYMNLPSTLNELGAHEPDWAAFEWRKAVSGPHPDFSFGAEWTYQWTTQALKTRSDKTLASTPIGSGALKNDYGQGLHAVPACNVQGD